MTCPVCSSTDTKYLFESQDTHGRHVNSDEKFSIYCCKKCSAAFLGGIAIDDDYYRKYYDKGYYEVPSAGNKTLLNRVLQAMFSFSIRQKEKLMLKYSRTKRPLSIIDIGCGNGDFLLRLPKEKFETHGIEINKDGYEICQQKGIHAYNQEIQRIDFQGKTFDIATMWHVLEHVKEPVEMLKAIRKILNDDGILMFQVPNRDSYGFRWGKKHWFHLDSPRHLIHFNRRSIKKLCELSGFEIIAIKNEFYDYPLDLFWSLRKSPLIFLVVPLYPFFKIASQETITVICRKETEADVAWFENMKNDRAASGDVVSTAEHYRNKLTN